MSFIFRTIFWLALAIVVLPPQQRIGGGDTADFSEVDLQVELHNAAYTFWSLATKTLNACETNPELCKASSDLWETTWTTAARMFMTRQEIEGSDELEDIRKTQTAAIVQQR